MKKLYDGTEVEISVATRMVDGKRYLLTEEEKSQRLAEELEAKSRADEIARERERSILDREIPDIYEELIDALGPSVEAKLSATLKAKLKRKKELKG